MMPTRTFLLPKLPCLLKYRLQCDFAPTPARAPGRRQNWDDGMMAETPAPRIAGRAGHPLVCWMVCPMARPERLMRLMRLMYLPVWPGPLAKTVWNRLSHLSHSPDPPALDPR